MPAFSRRSLFGLLLAARPACFGASLPVDALAAETVSPSSVGRSCVRKYRIHATITLLGVPIFTRKDVGSGFASVERINTDSTEVLSFRFAAGSIPERAQGLHRAGSFTEIVAHRSDGALRASYFGFMTHSPENDFEQAKASLAKQNGSVLFQAISGSVEAGRAGSTVYSIDAPGAVQWPRWQQLTSHIRAHLPESGQQKVVPLTNPAARTFLHAIYQGLDSQDSKRRVPVVYNGKLYTLGMSKAAERNAGTRVEGFMEQQQHRGDRSPFKLWYRPEGNGGNLLPERIETNVRSFLRLSFEADPTLDLATGPLLDPGAGRPSDS